MRFKLHSETYKTLTGANNTAETISVFTEDTDSRKPSNPSQLCQSFRVGTIRFVQLC